MVIVCNDQKVAEAVPESVRSSENTTIVNVDWLNKLLAHKDITQALEQLNKHGFVFKSQSFFVYDPAQ